MTHLTILSLLVCLLAATVQASNPVFGAYQTDSCNACLDQTYESFPGDYKTRSYATCMCAGDGSANFVTCLSSCGPNKDEPAIASSTYYGYCVLFFKELCDGAEEFLTEKIYNEQCYKGLSPLVSDKTKDSDSEEADEANETLKTDSATKMEDRAEATHTSNSAVDVIVPA
ncbi:hypothetical protein FGRMN_921 [Fusarium graminum]|nr:hypothetical protein FGRMN_921 [Fusarium graminum]